MNINFDKLVETDRDVYHFCPNDRDEKLMLITERKKGEENIIAKKNWEYSLWSKIGERGGLAEAGELLVENGFEDINIKIENYIDMYKDEIKNAKSIEQIFDDYKIICKAFRNKIIKNNYHNRIIPEKFEEEFKMEKSKEIDGTIYYKDKEIKTVEELLKLPIEYIDYSRESDFNFTMLFAKK